MWPFRKKEERASLENPNTTLSAFFAGMPSETGVVVTHENALSVPAVWAAVNFLSDTIASLPLKVYEKDGENTVPLSNDPVYNILHDAPNDEMTSFKWRKVMMTTVLTRGRSFSFIERSPAGIILNIWPLDPDRVTLEHRMGRTTYKYRDSDAREVIFDSSEIIDLPFMLDSDGLNFYNPVERLKNTIGLAIALETYASKFFSSGGVPPLQLVGPFNSPATAERAAFDIGAAIKGVRSKGGNVLPMPTGHELKPIGTDPTEGQMTEARRFQVEEVARIYGIPPVFLQDLSRATFNNVEAQALGLVKHTLGQWIQLWEQELNLKIFGRGNNTQFAKFSLDGLLRGDFSTRMAGYATSISHGIRTPNEVRELENLPSLEGGDDLMIQGATIKIKDQGLDLSPNTGEEGIVDG